MKKVSKKTNSIISLVTIISLLLFVGLGCNLVDSLTTKDDPKPTTPTGRDSDDKVEKEKSETPSDISGKYSATGTNVDDRGNYKADLEVTKRDDVYQFSWDSQGTKYEGVGIQAGDKVAVSFTQGTDGSGCGVILYEVNSDGSLKGKTGYWGANNTESETATRTSGEGLEGKYDVEGKNLKGETYNLKLNVKKQNEGYKFSWMGNRNWEGFGIKQGDTVSVGFGGRQCGFVAYEIKSDGSLEGQWGMQFSTSFGTEKAVKE